MARAEPGAPVLRRVTEWRQGEAVRHILGQDAEVRERPHEALERGRMGRPCRPGKLVHALRPLREVVSQTKFGCNATFSLTLLCLL